MPSQCHITNCRIKHWQQFTVTQMSTQKASRPPGIFLSCPSNVTLARTQHTFITLVVWFGVHCLPRLPSTSVQCWQMTLFTSTTKDRATCCMLLTVSSVIGLSEQVMTVDVQWRQKQDSTPWAAATAKSTGDPPGSLLRLRLDRTGRPDFKHSLTSCTGSETHCESFETNSNPFLVPWLD